MVTHNLDFFNVLKNNMSQPCDSCSIGREKGDDTAWKNNDNMRCTRTTNLSKNATSNQEAVSPLHSHFPSCHRVPWHRFRSAVRQITREEVKWRE